jgi:transposase
MAGASGSVAVAMEVPHGPVVDALQDRGFAVHAINPKQLDRLRDRFSVAGAKDDRRDAWIAAVGLRTDLQQERVRLGNRIRQQLLH